MPYIWVVPGITTPGSICDRPIDLMSIYPTLCDLTGLDIPAHVEGANIRRLLEDPEADWDGKALSTMGYSNHAVVDERYRYIRYKDGSEELYDHYNDPFEHTNLAGYGGQYDSIKTELSAWLPKNNMEIWDEKQTCTDSYDTDDDVFVKKCDDGSFVARDPNRKCKFVPCPAAQRRTTLAPTNKPTKSRTETEKKTTPTVWTSTPPLEYQGSMSHQPTNAPIQTPRFELKDGTFRSCNWPARKNPQRRCYMVTVDGELLKDLCPEACASVESQLIES